ncbi:MAG: hypothetical protein A3H70_03470 [Candidatus Komeilibacteria bacterium RIFCSPLOWO2_02_FULL_48_11]|uniref:Bacterial spore germination immunoglobulin-like domain-containing protein n=1 Tax=Candidatus Komeilibacteria bacterium RIFCSPLOWO2_02_FULL_48_11 TaxID=1798553 RepID=A0A1G2BSY5_9BACT|nr:MAG: hypothetical protein A3H70_03470 [Candidatus Komeilibacteria bacterium RIFCSPLOWO2_02_FULL_48_11]
MTKYIWITVCVITLILILGWKQAGKEPPVVLPEAPTEDVPVLEAGEPIVSESGNIKVTQPQPNSLVSSPMLVKGQARTFESTFQMVLKDGDGKEVTKKTVTYTAPDPSQFGDFGELLLFDTPKIDSGTLEVYSNSAKDGAVQDLVSIPVKFK